MNDTPMSDEQVGLTVKQMVQEVYSDMKVVRPLVETLQGQNLNLRVTALEADKRSVEAVRDTTMAFFRFGRWILATIIALCSVLVTLILTIHTIVA